ncbi:MAG: NADH:flavin oxidoreductase/NADH oxidase family protein [Rhizobiaceae bacterium]
MRSDIDILSETLKLPCGAVLKNRICKAAMTEGLAAPDNQANARFTELYRRWGESGAAVLITGNVLVDRWHLERGGNIAIDGPQSNEALAALADMAEAGKADGAHMWMQINHPGRQTQKMINKNPKAPSDIGLKMGNGRFGKPTPMTDDEVEATIDGFVNAAKVAEQTGFDGVQFHAAHGYLTSQFLSPLSNIRTDKWGGDLEGRARFIMEIIRRTRKAVKKKFAITVKLNSSDFQKGGFSDEDSVIVANWFEEAGVDLIEVSGGNYEQPRMLDFDRKDPKGDEKSIQKKRESTKKREAYFLEFVPKLRECVTIPVMVTGGFRTASAMGRAIEEDEIDMIGLARPFCTDIDIAERLLTGEVKEIKEWQDKIRIGRGLLSPTSPISFLRDLNAWGELGWYYEQIYRIADGQQPDFDLSGFKALMAFDKTEAKTAKLLVR